MNAADPAQSAMPQLSIIIATWQAASTLERALRSIVGQSFKDWELLISDGSSTDGTVDLIRKYETSIAWWQSRKDEGIYDAWNQALPHARGEYVCFLGADDAWSDRGALQAVFEAIDERQLDLVTAKGRAVDADARVLGTIGRRWDYKGLRRRMLICHPGALFRRQLFESIGLFDSSYKIAADYEWMLRLPASIRYLFVDRIVVQIQDDGTSRRSWKQTLNEYWRIQARSPRVGKLRATLTYIDRLWRKPVAKLLRIHY